MVSLDCPDCRGQGSVPDTQGGFEPCGGCRSCDRGDPTGCVSPVWHEEVVGERECPHCGGEGWH